MANSDVQNFFEGLAANVLPQTESYVVDYFKDTSLGGQINKNLQATVVTDWLKNPIVWIVGAVALFFILKGVISKG